MSNNNIAGIIGFGTMGRSLASYLYKNGWKLYVFDKDSAQTRKQKGIICCKSLQELWESVSVVFLSIKPQDILHSTAMIQKFPATRHHVLISIAAGVSTKLLEKKLSKVRIVRVMPNLALLHGLSISFIAPGKSAAKRDTALVKKIFAYMGSTYLIDERFMDKVTAITGSGPGYVFYFMEGIYKSAVRLGFSHELAFKMVLETFSGALHLIQADPREFSFWIKKVASRGGTTEAALSYWEQKKVSQLLQEGISCAVARAKELNLRK